MLVEAQVTIKGSKAATWAAIADIERAAHIFSGIQKIELVEKPASGLVGLRWRETRMLFGEEATVEKWITEAVDQEYYKTRAESDGFIFLTTHRLEGRDSSVSVVGIHETIPATFLARLKGLPMFLFKGVIRKAILLDLNDLKAAVERA